MLAWLLSSLTDTQLMLFLLRLLTWLSLRRPIILIPSPEGAWLLPDGRFLRGGPEEPPDPAALWRSCYDQSGFSCPYPTHPRTVLLSERGMVPPTQ